MFFLFSFSGLGWLTVVQEGLTTKNSALTVTGLIFSLIVPPVRLSEARRIDNGDGSAMEENSESERAYLFLNLLHPDIEMSNASLP